MEMSFDVIEQFVTIQFMHLTNQTCIDHIADCYSERTSYIFFLNLCSQKKYEIFCYTRSILTGSYQLFEIRCGNWLDLCSKLLRAMHFDSLLVL